MCEILIDAIEHGVSIGFLAPVDLKEADTFWRRVERAVAEGRRKLLAAALADGTVAGTVQLVHSAAGRQGIGEALVSEVERVAIDAGRWLLTLDTATPEPGI